ncbi:PIR protein [Plasmodium yoelii]|uniref:PIR protein n=2 Tax=Plasmodium yoelii TaxID=5861 RepID=A0AAE9WJN8_PLAYO|nr:PIR protein [Plasmodium yoelii]WBY54880.1 PIR protein [Plasmodium yoelii yoelii]CDS44439.1 YIR protein [Plasmodium yoelii]VTZ71906.1 PIR protein [Plasmodium yoelii]|eukprot:XP_022810768.1 PIR protein [Plasmodium yoelii]
MSSNVCGIINTVDKYVVDDPNNPGKYNSTYLLKLAFPKNDCSSDDQELSSYFIALLTLLNDNNKNENLEGDKLVEYAILWLSYKLNQKKENGMTILNDFYTNNVVKNSCYYQKINDGSDSSNKINKDVIKKKIESMNIDIKDISNFYDAFKSLCNMSSEIGANDYECNKCLENAGEFFEKCEKVKNAFDINKGSSYLQLWSSLLNDYEEFKKKYNNLGCDNFSSLVACPRSSVTKNILITIGMIFVAASILLGVSYKYSLFGFRKRFQKQKLREKLKK